MTDARSRYLDRQRRYNTSAKGQARNLRYEARHPERKLRWEPARNMLRNVPGTLPETLPEPPREDDDPWGRLDDRGGVDFNRGNPRSWQCACCDPPRQIYMQALGRINVYRHEADHTRAELYRPGVRPP